MMIEQIMLAIFEAVMWVGLFVTGAGLIFMFLLIARIIGSAVEDAR